MQRLTEAHGDLQAVAGRRPRSPLLRIGAAYGPVVTRAHDVFGHTVNIGARIDGRARARPGPLPATLPRPPRMPAVRYAASAA